MAKRTPLAERLDEVKQRIADAAAKANRDPREVTLVAVTKNAAPEQIRELITLSAADLGENRVQQLVMRAGQIDEFLQRRQIHGDGAAPAKIRWHMIGHLQRNKIKLALPVIAMVHSVDSLRLAEELDTQAANIDRKLPVLMQLNASEEPSKFGVAVGAAIHLAEQIDSMPNLQFAGLMTMAELDATPERIRHTFARTREVFEEMKWHKIGGANLRHLSMGMSHDFELAIAEGATLVRIGTALFGGPARDQQAEDEN